ncbi:MAG: cobalamin-binding protein [Gemmatimonadaceae bacterium]|nr:cobalamin-binding protein [Gemmatimonadaceae bacterium]
MTRIVSFLPAGTEILYAVGAGSELLGRSHECDFPPEVLKLPIVSRPALNLEEMSQAEIDEAVASRLKSGESLYEVDELLLRELAPDVIITQDLCQVCAPSGNELTRAVRDLPQKPELVWLSPQTLADIEENILQVGEASGYRANAEGIIKSNRARIADVQAAVSAERVRRVVFLEWTEPLFSAGHWVPEMIELAGGHDPLGKPGTDSVRMTWEEVRGANPEIIIVSPCGYRLDQSRELAAALDKIPGAKVFAVDANAYFARPGPRIAEAIELLAHLFHPERVTWPHATRPWELVP